MRTISIVFILCLLLCACHTKRQTQTEFVYINTTDTIHDVKLRIDSVSVTDSIVTFIKGDTVLIEKWHKSYRDRLRVDTVEKIRTEIVYQTKTETQLVEVNKLYWWQKTLMWIGGIAMAVIAGIIIWKLKRTL